MILIRPRNRGSLGARAVREALENKARLGGNYRRINDPRFNIIINWGNSKQLEAPNAEIIVNPPASVSNAVNKIKALGILKEAGVRVPTFTTDKSQASGGTWLARTKIKASEGKGIKVVREGDAIPDAPLYTKYVAKKAEYRIHVFDGRVIFKQQKRKRNGVEQNGNQKLIRSYRNGWVFTVNDVNPSQAVLDLAVKAVNALGLTFGGVDVIVEKGTNKAYVLEVNTAPAIESPTLKSAYVETIKELYCEP